MVFRRYARASLGKVVDLERVKDGLETVGILLALVPPRAERCGGSRGGSLLADRGGYYCSSPRSQHLERSRFCHPSSYGQLLLSCGPNKSCVKAEKSMSLSSAAAIVPAEAVGRRRLRRELERRGP